MADLNNEILGELQHITRLLVLLAIKDKVTQRDKIASLANVGFRPKEIADLIGTTPNTVSVALVDIRKKGGSNNGKAKAASRQRADRADDTIA